MLWTSDPVFGTLTFQAQAQAQAKTIASDETKDTPVTKCSFVEAGHELSSPLPDSLRRTIDVRWAGIVLYDESECICPADAVFYHSGTPTPGCVQVSSQVTAEASQGQVLTINTDQRLALVERGQHLHAKKSTTAKRRSTLWRGRRAALWPRTGEVELATRGVAPQPPFVLGCGTARWPSYCVGLRDVGVFQRACRCYL